MEQLNVDAELAKISVSQKLHSPLIPERLGWTLHIFFPFPIVNKRAETLCLPLLVQLLQNLRD